MNIKLTPKEFGDFVCAFLFECMRNEEIITLQNTEFSAILELLKEKGFRTALNKYYLNMSPKDRAKFKRVVGVFDGTETRSNIEVLNIDKMVGIEAEKEVKKSFIQSILNLDFVKDIAKKSFKKAKLVKERTRFPISDEKLEKIINEEITKELNKYIKGSDYTEYLQERKRERNK